METKELLKTLLDLEHQNNTKEINKMIESHNYDDNPAFLYYLAHLYFVGYIYEKDVNKSIDLLRDSSLKGYASASYMLSTIYETSNYVTVNITLANEYLLEAVKGEYMPAVNHLGEVKEIGRLDIIKNEKEAFELYKKCYENNYQKGIINYARALLYKVGNPGDQVLGLQIINDYVAKNDKDALYILGKCYCDGVGVKPSYIKGNYFLLEAAEKGSAIACKTLGDCYYDGVGVSVDHKRAFNFYKLAADLGDVDAAQIVSNCYLFGDGIQASYKEAVSYCVKRAKGGDKQAQLILGNRYYYGDGFRKNPHRALYWYQEAAKQNEPAALKICGDMFVVGEGCKKDIARGAEYYIKAVEMNNYDAAFPLAELYSKGKKGFKKNDELAVKYYKIAYLQNDSHHAAYEYAELISKGRGVLAPDYSNACKAYVYAAEDNILPAIKKAGEYYLKGIGVNKDYECALRYYLIASQKGDEESTILVNVIRRSMEFN